MATLETASDPGGECGFQSLKVEFVALWWVQGYSKSSESRDGGDVVQGQRSTSHGEDTSSSECEGPSSVCPQRQLESIADRNEICFSNWVIGRVNPIPLHTSDKIEREPVCSWVALKIVMNSKRSTRELSGLLLTGVICKLNLVTT